MKTQILKMMIDEKMGSNELCQQCRSLSDKKTNALGPWVTCSEICPSKSLLFVGKVARGDDLGEEISECLEDVTAFGTSFIAKSSWAYWSYTRNIIEKVFGDLNAGLNQISFTNMIKCNNDTLQDTTESIIKDYCISKNRFIWKEIELIKPKLAIFYTHYDYDDFLDEYVPQNSVSFQDNESRTHQVSIGKKTMPWWDRSFYDECQKEVFRFLRVGHPERKNKQDYVGKVSSWISTHK